MTIVAEKFEAELANRDIPYSIKDDGRYEISVGDSKLAVSIDNIRRDFDRDGDLSAVSRFVDTVLDDLKFQTPSWNDARNFVRFSLEPADYATGFSDVVHNVINDELVQLYVLSSPDRKRISWISPSHVSDWGITVHELKSLAESNMSQLVENARLETKDIDGNLLGMISTELTEFKSSLVLSPGFRKLVETTHGWPVFAVLPCRDFAYVVRCDHQEFLGRLGGVVIDEYNKSGYPITKDVLKISDEGITAIGTFPDRQQSTHNK